MGSDHRPIVMKIQTPQECRKDKKIVWKWKGADWSSFKTFVDRRLKMLKPDEMDVTRMEQQLRETIIKAARKFVGKKAIDQRQMAPMSEEAKQEAERRDQLICETPEKVEEIEEATDNVRKLIAESRRSA